MSQQVRRVLSQPAVADAPDGYMYDSTAIKKSQQKIDKQVYMFYNIKMSRIIHSRTVKIILSHLGLAAVIFLWARFIGCPLLRVFSIPCPGCGMTRACLRLVMLDFAGAWYYHPLVFVVPFSLLWLFHYKAFRLPFGETGAKIVLIATLILLIAVYIIRMFFADGFLQTL